MKGQEGILIETKKNTSSAEETRIHNEAIDFVEKHRDIFEHYARGKVRFEPAPAGLDTFAFNLQDDVIYINPMFYKELGFSDEKTSFATLHEVEHFLEKKQVLNEKDGQRTFEKYLKQLDSKAYGVMDNCVADIRENRTVVSKTHQGFKDIEERCYKEDLFKETDFTDQPKHIQLPYALLREARVPDESCTVAPEVRVKIDELQNIKGKDGTSLLDVMTNPATPMSARLKLQEKFIWPMVQDLLEEDKKEKKEKQEGDRNGKSDSSESSDQNKEGQSDPQKGDKQAKANPQGKPSGKGDKGENANDMFAESYQEADKKVPNAVPIEKIKEALKEWKKSMGGENALDTADKEYAEKLGVTKEQLQNYRRIAESLSKITNPETGATAIEELRSIFSRIISERLKPAQQPRYPLEEGEDLVDPAGLVAEAKGGNLEPKVWETFETKERKGKKFGEVEFTVVGDRSSSMAENGALKLREQQRAVVLAMEALKEFADLCDEERVNMDKPLEIRSEVYSFQSNTQDGSPLKKMSKELGEKERIEVATTFASATGRTTDFVPLEAIEKNMTTELREKIKEGEVKKIVVVFTDGGSDDGPRVEKILSKLKEAGIIVIGVGITQAGQPALVTYAPNARLAETAEKLPVVLTDILKEHLNSI